MGLGHQRREMLAAGTGLLEPSQLDQGQRLAGQRQRTDHGDEVGDLEGSLRELERLV